MDIKIDKFKQLFFDELDRVLLPLGFKYVKNKHGYILKNKDNWYFRFLVDCTKWSNSVSVQTKISAINLILKKTFNEICETNHEGLKIWGVYPTINNFLEQELLYKPEQSLYIYLEEDIQKVAKAWLTDFENIGIPFMEKITNDCNFALQLVVEGRGTILYDRYRYLPIMCKEAKMSNEDIEKLCTELEKDIDDINNSCPFSEEYKKKWIEEYYKVRDTILERISTNKASPLVNEKLKN